MAATTAASSVRLQPALGSGRMALWLLGLALAVALVVAAARNSALDPAAATDLGLITALALSAAVAVIIVFRLFGGLIDRLGSRAGSVIAFLLAVTVAAAASLGLAWVLDAEGLLSVLPASAYGTFGLRVALVAALTMAIALSLRRAPEALVIESEGEQAAKLQALQSRIRPHFLFNSMNSIASLIRSDPEQAEHALQDLADVFRVLLADARKLVPITAEIEIARQYLAIEKMRLGDRLQVKWVTSKVPIHAKIPSLTLQPLLENAIYHGIEPRFSGGLIKIEVWIEGESLYFLITNPVPELPTKAHRKGNQIAMDNIRERMERHFGSGASMQTFEQFGNYHVKLRIPLLKE